MSEKNNSKTGDIQVRFLSAPPHSTMSIELEYGTEPPSGLMEALSGIGWFRTLKGPLNVPARRCTVMERNGSGPRGGWSPDEARRYVGEAREVLGRLGHGRVRHVRLPLPMPQPQHSDHGHAA